ILELDLLGDRHAVLGDRRVPELLLDDDVATLRTEGDLHRVGQLVHAPLEARAGLRIEFEVLGSHLFLPAQLSLAMTSDSLIRMISSSSSSTCEPVYFPYTTRSPTLSSIGTRWPFSIRPGPTAMTSPWIGFSLAVSGM